MRLIDVDDALGKIEKIYEEHKNSKNEIEMFVVLGSGIKTGLDTAIKILEDAPTIETLPVMHWTNIDEAMPKIGVMVLMHRPTKFTAVMSLKYYDERFWWENHRREERRWEIPVPATYVQ